MSVIVSRVSDQPSESVAAVVGRNCRRLRTGAGLTQDELARHAKRVGLRWTAASVGDFESGRSSPAFGTVLCVGLALQAATGRNVTLADLLAGNTPVALSPSLEVAAHVLADVCRGEPYRLEPATWRPTTRPFRASEVNALVAGDADKLLARSGLAEQRLARQLGVSPTWLAAASSTLWQRTFSEERDHRSGPEANSQKRGRVSRILRTELQEALAHGNDQ